MQHRPIQVIDVTPGDTLEFVLATDAKLGQDEVQRIAQKFLADEAEPVSSGVRFLFDRGLHIDAVIVHHGRAENEW